jgi:hypothetical protein
MSAVSTIRLDIQEARVCFGASDVIRNTADLMHVGLACLVSGRVNEWRGERL